MKCDKLINKFFVVAMKQKQSLLMNFEQIELLAYC